LDHLVVLIPGKLGFAVTNIDKIEEIKKASFESNIRLVTSNLHRSYSAFANDFGPVNLGVVHRFCNMLSRGLKIVEGCIVYCVEPSSESIANAAFLLGSYLILNCGITPRDAAKPFVASELRLRPFRDATYQESTLTLSLPDCLAALARAHALRWYVPGEFDAGAYDLLADPAAGGDLHRICPKIIAFKGPLAPGSRQRHPGETAHPPAAYVATLRQMGARCVVRLNEPWSYDKEEFERAGIRLFG
jgi:hypothetical protein